MQVIERASFAGHETFPFRYTWLKKAVQQVKNNPAAFAKEDAMVELGVGKNMVRSIRHWALACGVLAEDESVSNNRGRALRVTDLGEALLGPTGLDPYLEDPMTVWLLHWKLASTPYPATSWYYVFNCIPKLEFSKKDLVNWIVLWAQEQNFRRITETSLRRDIDCLVRSYVPARPSRSNPLEDSLDCPLNELGLIQEFGARDQYLLIRGDHPTLPDELVAYALAEYLDEKAAGQRTVPLEDIAFKPGGPGRALCLSEAALLLRLEQLERVTEGALSYNESAGIKQVFVEHFPDRKRLLKRYYERGRNGNSKGHEGRHA